MFLLAGILCMWAFTPATPTTQVHPPPHPHFQLLLSRLDRLEGLLADHQAQWQKEKRVLTDTVHLLQGDVQALEKEKREMRQQTEIQIQTLTAQNQVLKTELGEVHRRLLSMTRTSQQSLQDLVTQYGTKPRPDQDEPADSQRHEKEYDKKNPIHKESGSSKHVQRTAHHSDDQDKHPIQKESSPATSQHTARRSDDGDPLEAVTSHLSQQVTLLTADVQALKTSDAQQQEDIQAARGSTFVQWGSSTCSGSSSSSSELVYSGVVGGSWYGHKGAAANPLCLTMSPRLLNWPTDLNYYASVYGAEYETEDSHYQKDPVCAVCRSSLPTTIMVPGTDECSPGWTRQYSGFLMAGHYNYDAATMFICVDAKMESRASSDANNNGYLMYYTKAKCGSLPCLPYVDNTKMTCAVCSK